MEERGQELDNLGKDLLGRLLILDENLALLLPHWSLFLSLSSFTKVSLL